MPHVASIALELNRKLQWVELPVFSGFKGGLRDQGLAVLCPSFLDDCGYVHLGGAGADTEDGGDFGIGFPGEEVGKGFSLAAGEGFVIQGWDGEGNVFPARLIHAEAVVGDGDMLAQKVDHEFLIRGKRAVGVEADHGSIVIMLPELDTGMIHDAGVAIELLIDGVVPQLPRSNKIV